MADRPFFGDNYPNLRVTRFRLCLLLLINEDFAIFKFASATTSLPSHSRRRALSSSLVALINLPLSVDNSLSILAIAMSHFCASRAYLEIESLRPRIRETEILLSLATFAFGV